MQQGMKGKKQMSRNRRHSMWLPVAAGGEKEITSSPPHTGDAKEEIG